MSFIEPHTKVPHETKPFLQQKVWISRMDVQSYLEFVKAF